MTGVLSTSLAARSTILLLFIVALVGLGLLLIAVPLTQQQEKDRQDTRLRGLLLTVQDAASIACFLSDKQLADEIAEGLLKNQTVREVVIRAGTVELAHRERNSLSHNRTDPTSTPLRRQLESPFTPGEVVGDITLVPDAGEIARNVQRSTRFITLLFIVQVAVTGLGGALVVIRLIARPITNLSSELHELRAESGQKLAIPRGNEADEIGQLVRDVNTMADHVVSALNQERQLRQEQEIESQKFRAIFEHADTGIFLIDAAGIVISGNPAFAGLFNIPEPAMHSRDGLKLIDLVGEHASVVSDLIARCAEENQPLNLDLKLSGKPGMPARWVSVVLSPIEGGRMQGVANDVTQHKLAEESAQQLAATDHLTGLGNRLGLERRLQEMIEQGYRRPRSGFTLLMMDLDRFKQVNDTHGHKAGDEVLITVARRLEHVVRKTDFVGRLGGDEFVVLLTATMEPHIIETINQKIIAAIDQPISIDAGGSVQVGVSIGAASFGDPAPTRDELIRRADTAMYAAKQAGRNTYRFYTEPAPA
jgi:diguanylate cyclase (GGDEF)-like protein/PAS domain S-box-containing protein